MGYRLTWVYMRPNGTEQRIRPVWPSERPDIDTYSLTTSKTGVTGQHAICISPDGKYLYLYSWNIYSFYLSDWSLNSYTGTAASTSSSVDSRWIFFKDENTIYSFSDSGTFQQVSMSNYDLSGGTVTTLSNNIGSGKAWCEFNPDGTKFYCTQWGYDAYEYSLSTAYNPNTATLDYTLPTTWTIDYNNYCIRFSPTGKKVFISNRSNGTNWIYQYDCSTARDLSTATYSNKSLTLGYGSSFDVTEDWTIFTISFSSAAIYQYNAS